jgi:anti-sigma-K factor RskA
LADHERLKDLLPAYALGAVTADDAASMHEHLESCAACSHDLGMLLTTAAELEGDRPPPAGVWERIAAEIEQADHVATVTLLGERRTRRGLSLLAGVAAAVALVFAGFILARLSDGDPLGDQAVLAAAEDAARQEGAIVTELLVDEAPVAELILTAGGKGFVIPTDSLPVLDESRTYQLWVINTADAVISAGVLGANPAPAAFTWAGDVAGLALTREIAGGVVSSEGDVVSAVTDL